VTLGVKLVTQLTNRGLNAKRPEQRDRYDLPQNAFLVLKMSCYCIFDDCVTYRAMLSVSTTMRGVFSVSFSTLKADSVME